MLMFWMGYEIAGRVHLDFVPPHMAQAWHFDSHRRLSPSIAGKADGKLPCWFLGLSGAFPVTFSHTEYLF